MSLLKFFKTEKDSEELKIFTVPLEELAWQIETNLPNGSERTTALRKLLEARDAITRSVSEVVLSNYGTVTVTSEDKSFGFNIFAAVRQGQERPVYINAKHLWDIADFDKNVLPEGKIHHCFDVTNKVIVSKECVEVDIVLDVINKMFLVSNSTQELFRKDLVSFLPHLCGGGVKHNL